MRVKILKRSFAGAEFAPDIRVLKVGGQSSAGVERLEFELPAEWQGLSVTLHVQWLDGTLPAPVLLDEEGSVAVDKTLTASPSGQWMLLALGADGYRALTRPARYECYGTLNTEGDVEISPSQYEAFVARVLESANAAQTYAKNAEAAAGRTETAAGRAETAQAGAKAAAQSAGEHADKAEESAGRAEDAAARAEELAPLEGAVVSVNGKGGAVHLTAKDVGAMPASGAAVVQSIRLEGRTLTVTMADGSEKSFTTQDTTSLPAMTGVLGTEHGGTGKETPLTAEDVGAVEAGSSVYIKALTVQGSQMTVTKGDGSTETVTLAKEYSLPTATASRLGGVKIGDYLDIAADGTLSGKTLNDKITASVAVKSDPRLVWNYGEFDLSMSQSITYKIPDGVDYIIFHAPWWKSGTDRQIARGNSITTEFGTMPSSSDTRTLNFQTNGTLLVTCSTRPGNMHWVYKCTMTGYHYPTIADLLAETQAALADADALNLDQDYRLTLLELGVTDDDTTDNT